MGAGSGAPGNINLEALRNDPQIQQLRNQIAQNPELIQGLVQQLATQNPALASQIAQNPEALLQILAPEMGDDLEGRIPPGAHVLNVTEEERAAIQRVRFCFFILFACCSPIDLLTYYCSWRSWDFRGAKLRKRFLLVTRMKILLQIFFSKMHLKMIRRLDKRLESCNDSKCCIFYIGFHY